MADALVASSIRDANTAGTTWRELGAARFLWQYLGAYARGRAAGLGHQRAYEAIPLEVEARELAGR